MKCPVCSQIKMKELVLSAGLRAEHCSNCGGVWVSSAKDGSGLKKHGPDLPERVPERETFSLSDTRQAKLCPECGRIMRLYRVKEDIDFLLDQCRLCQGVWFDKNEYEALRARNLHDNLHEFFTSSWQRKLRQDEERKKMDQLYENRFGAEGYQKVKEFKQWLDRHDQRSGSLAYCRVNPEMSHVLSVGATFLSRRPDRNVGPTIRQNKVDTTLPGFGRSIP